MARNDNAERAAQVISMLERLGEAPPRAQPPERAPPTEREAAARAAELGLLVQAQAAAAQRRGRGS